jgi:hypothetical protein
MPPLPLTFDGVTSASIASIQRRQSDLRDIQIPRLRSCSESLATQQQYAAELREDLEAIMRLIEVRIYGFSAYMRTKLLSVVPRRIHRHPTR